MQKDGQRGSARRGYDESDEEELEVKRRGISRWMENRGSARRGCNR
jgi:hypothetical protein